MLMGSVGAGAILFGKDKKEKDSRSLLGTHRICLANKVLGKDSDFYARRGVFLVSLDWTGNAGGTAWQQ